MSELLDRYVALALQVDCDGVHVDTDRAAASLRMQRSLQRIDTAIGGARRWVGADLKLVVLPEYVLTGPPWGETIPQWADKAALALDGPEAEAAADAETARLLLSPPKAKAPVTNGEGMSPGDHAVEVPK